MLKIGLMFWIIAFWVAFVLAVVYQIRLGRKNKYVRKHKEYLKNEKLYESYLRWCENNVQVPMDKEIYIKEIERKHTNLNDLLK